MVAEDSMVFAAVSLSDRSGNEPAQGRSSKIVSAFRADRDESPPSTGNRSTAPLDDGRGGGDEGALSIARLVDFGTLKTQERGEDIVQGRAGRGIQGHRGRCCANRGDTNGANPAAMSVNVENE
jgi:hypothetical protein